MERTPPKNRPANGVPARLVTAFGFRTSWCGYTVLVSVLKYSRYFWYWKSISSPEPGAGSAEPTRIPDWVWADIIGMELGGPLVSAIASTVVYLDQR